MAVHPAALAAELEIDKIHETHALLKRPFAQAITHLLRAADLATSFDAAFEQQDRMILLTRRLNALKHAVRWIHESTNRPSVDFRTTNIEIAEANGLLHEADNYLQISAAYSFARRDLIDLNATGKRLLARIPEVDMRYDAYDLLTPASVENLRLASPIQFQTLDSEILRAWRVGVSPMRIPLLERVAKTAVMFSAGLHAPYYNLAPESCFATFTLGEFQAFINALRGITVAWMRVCDFVADEDPAFVARQPLPIDRGDLRDVLKISTGLTRKTVNRMIDLLTYGKNIEKNPDPVLQPIIALDERHVILSTTLTLGGSPERNLIALINRLTDERAAYDRIKQGKEELMRRRIANRLPPYLRMWSGRLGGDEGLPDVDCALIDDKARAVLLLELKSFMAPAEPREIVERDTDIAKGVQQAKALLRAVSGMPSLLNPLLRAPVQTVGALVVSENSIGTAAVQDSTIPVIREDHLILKIQSVSDLMDVHAWLAHRRFLPIEGRDFAVREIETKFFDWTLNWYGVEAITKGDFLPV